MDRVLDTAALLHWPVEKLSGGICAPSQHDELSRLSEARAMLLEGAAVEWQQPLPAWLVRARHVASDSGDLPRLSSVDIDVLALALGLEAILVTDDYRLQNAYRSHGELLPVVNAPSTQQWTWELNCTGCRQRSVVPPTVSTSKRGPVGECDRCGSPTVVKRRRS